ncbi:MAG: hypothetical protein WAV89_05090 [Ignavibacteriaceae bacterium]
MIVNKHIVVILLIASVMIFAQNQRKVSKEGKVGYTSSQFVYIRFNNTEGISEGDTLFIKVKNDLKPALIVKFLSSSSVACEKLGNNNFDKDLIVFTKPDKEQKINTEPEIPEVKNEVIVPELIDENKVSVVNKEKNNHTKISGGYSIQSYSEISNLNIGKDYQRWRHSLRLGIQNIEGSQLTFSTYTIFSYRADQWYNVSSNLGRALKVYDLSLGYQFNKTTKLLLGRNLNGKISNISIVDGAQFEKAFSLITAGLVVGSRPNFTDFGLNTKLFEYGLYLNRLDSIFKGVMENTISFFQQTNNFKTDRRFGYFQHRNNIVANTTLFVSAEVDLYKKELGISKNDFSLTSLFISTRYAPVREFSIDLSYDARKNVYYYETFKSISDSILENETRQGFRARSTIRPFNYLTIGLQYGYRYSKSDAKPSRNFGGYISYTILPLIRSSIGINVNRLLSNYLNGYVYSINLNKSLTALRSDISVGFRKTDYSFINNALKLDEKALLTNFSTNIFNPFLFAISYEGVFESTRSYGRILLDLTTRF